MICNLEINNNETFNIEHLYKLFKSEHLESDRTKCFIEKNNKKLLIKVESKDIVAMKSFLNTILKIIETYEKAK